MSFAPQTYRQGRGNVMYKALAHPMVTEASDTLVRRLSELPELSVFDPNGQFSTCDAFLNLSEIPNIKRYCADSRQRADAVEPITHYRGGPLLVLDFDYPHLAHLAALSASGPVFDLNEIKLPSSWQTASSHYLSPLNFVYDFALFQHHCPRPGIVTRITTANYWARYGAQDVRLQCLLLDDGGQRLAGLTRQLNEADALIEISSDQLARDHDLAAFSGQLMLHAVGAAGHDVMKYVCDQYDATDILTTTHDANSWPAARYGGIPLPTAADEKVSLWIQNPHCREIPAGTLSVSTASNQTVTLQRSLGPLETYSWPLHALPGSTQVTLTSARHLARPRYSISRGDKHHLAHANVVRDDLTDDAGFWKQGKALGRGYLLTAPLLTPADYQCEVLVTPMSGLSEPAAIRLQTFSAKGLEMSDLALASGESGDPHWQRVDANHSGHLELSYDPQRQGPVDGWLHAIFRYRHKASGHQSETSFGSHMFNMLATYGSEPQSYNGPPPGLRTRLFGRPPPVGCRGFFVLIYPVSQRWHEFSDTQITLLNAQGKALGQRHLAIPQSGSLTFFVDDLFGSPLPDSQYQILIRDTRCRLFGYHGLTRGEGETTCFSIDHLFGF
ncbi:MAG: hypothetical protein AB8B96_07595 [Lysobacterales bacterium]